MKSNFEHLIEHVEPNEFSWWGEVDLEICTFTDLGLKVEINHEYAGLVYASQINEQFYEEQKLNGYITGVREYGRIDFSLQPDKGRHVHSTFDKILDPLKAMGGKSEFGDKSSTEDVRKEFQVSKKVFRHAIGGLYKKSKIKISNEGIKLV